MDALCAHAQRHENQRCMLSATKQAISIKLATTVGHFSRDLDLDFANVYMACPACCGVFASQTVSLEIWKLPISSAQFGYIIHNLAILTMWHYYNNNRCTTDNYCYYYYYCCYSLLLLLLLPGLLQLLLLSTTTTTNYYYYHHRQLLLLLLMATTKTQKQTTLQIVESGSFVNRKNTNNNKVYFYALIQ